MITSKQQVHSPNIKISKLVSKLNAKLNAEGDCDVTVRLSVTPQQARSVQDVYMGGMFDGSGRFVILDLDSQDEPDNSCKQ